MKDLISKKAFIDGINKKWPYHDDIAEIVESLPDDPGVIEYLDKQYELAYESGRKSAQEWIPVSEKLPDEYEDVLVAVEHDDGSLQTLAATFDGEDFDGYGCDFGKATVYAWMLFPEPATPSKTVTLTSDEVIGLIDSIAWYRLKDGVITEGASDESEALFKADDIYKAIEKLIKEKRERNG